MKLKSKVIISAVVSASLMLAGAVGGTIAFFTTSSQTNVNVTSGKISVTSVVSDLATYSFGVPQTPGTFENGGTATLSDHTVLLDRMTPGDKATFKIALTNTSNVKIKYRVALDVTGDLAPALTTTGASSGWTRLEPGATISDVNASVEMSSNIGIEYSDKAGSVKVIVEAVQGNMPDSVSTATELQNAIAAIPSTGGEVSVYLENDITVNQVLEIPSNSNVNIYGDGNTKIIASSGVKRPIILDAIENTTLTISGVDIQGSNYTEANGIGFWDTEDCVVNLYDVDLTMPDYYGINVGTGNDNLVINVSDSNVQAWGALNIWSSNTTINISNSTLNGTNTHSGTSNAFGVVVTNGGAKNVTVNLVDSVVNAAQQGDQFEAFFLIRDEGFVLNSTNTTYNFTRPNAASAESYASIEEVLDYNSFVRTFGTTSNAYIGVGSMKLQYEEGEEAKSCQFFFENTFANTSSVTDVSNYYVGEVSEALNEYFGHGYSVSNSTVNGKHFVYADYYSEA